MKIDANTEPKRAETRLSIALLAILILVGAGVYQRQFELNPAVVAVRPESHQKHLSTDSKQDALIDTAGSEIAPFSPRERFGPDDLYEKINGRADLYLASGFVSLQSQRFTYTKNTDQWVEAFIYDMATQQNAFSVFSMQRRAGARVDNNMAHAYHTENALFMTYGNVYLELIGTDASDEGKQAREILSDRFKDAHDDWTKASLPGVDLFPGKGVEPGTLQLIVANAFGHEILDQVYTGEYVTDGVRSTAFVSVRENTEMASSLADDYRKTLLSYGASAVDTATGTEGAVVVQLFDTYEIIFSRGKFLAGVHEAQNLETAIRLASALSAHLEGFSER